MGHESGSAKETAMNVYGVDFSKPLETQAKMVQILTEKGYNSPDFKTLVGLAEQYFKQEQDGEDELKKAA